MESTSVLILPKNEDDGIDYPESDGKPMAETDEHRDLMIQFIEGLKDFYRNDSNVYVAGNLFVYFKKGHPSASVTPDCFVVKGVPKKRRRTFKVWQEGKGPDWVIEFTSYKTKDEDLFTKRYIYENELCVKEYFLFDPLGDYLDPPFQGYRLEQKGYERLPFGQRLYSQVLGLAIGVEEGELRLYDPLTVAKILTPMEAQEERRKEKAARKKAEEAQRKAEEAQKKESVARRKAEKAQRKAEDEIKLAKEHAAKEKELRQRLELELAALKAQLKVS